MKRTIKTCAEARELQSLIAMNLQAIKRTVPVVDMAIEDEDSDLAIKEIGHLLSQAGGLLAMIEKAKANRINLNTET
jgi:hypothetical protein